MMANEIPKSDGLMDLSTSNLRVYVDISACFLYYLAIAQLVERWTVEVKKLISIGHWFDSGSRDFCIVFVFAFARLHVHITCALLSQGGSISNFCSGWRLENRVLIFLVCLSRELKQTETLQCQVVANLIPV